MAGRPRVVTTAVTAPATMVERSRELAALRACLTDVRDSQARVTLLEGPAGVGKTALLRAARDLAVTDGFRVLWARMPYLAATAPHELLRRLLGPEVERRGGPGSLTGAAAFAAPLFTPGTTTVTGVDYGCQWLLAALADDGPLLLAIDDVHWADVDSLRILVDAVEDLQGAPIGVVATARPMAADPAVAAMLSRLATLGGAGVLRPEPLSEAGVAEVLCVAFGREPEQLFTLACAQASGGNVFYLRELVRPLVAAGLPPTAAAAAELAASGPQALAATVLWRLDQLGPVATELAQAAAVLGDDVPLRVVAALARAEGEPAGRAAAALEAASILVRADPVVFPHPLVRAAVEHTVAPGQLGRLHAAAARVLLASAAPAPQVARHLLRAPPGGAEGTVGLLVDEARRTLDSGSPETAHRLLTRALAEPPSPAARPPVLLALAEAERATGAPARAQQHLAEVVETGPRELSISAMAELFDLLYELDDEAGADSLRLRAFAAEPYGASPAELRLRAALLLDVAAGRTDRAPERLTRVDLDRLGIGTGEQRYLLLCVAIHQRATGECPPERFLSQLRRVVHGLPDDRPLTGWEVSAALESAAFLASVEAMADADRVLERLRPDVARLRRASPALQAEWSHRSALNGLRRGRFEEALVVLAEAELFADRHGLTVYGGLARGARGYIALERGDYAEAGRHLLDSPAEAVPARALGELLSGRPERALALLDPPPGDGSAATEREIEFEVHLLASHACQMLNDREGAVRESDREVAVRLRHGPSFQLALALRRRASFAPAREAEELLVQAMEACADTPRLPIRARVRASYGAALRRAGRLRAARAELAAALDLAERLGMTRLSGRVAADIRAAGGRPRRARVTGWAALTGSQAAVARLAAEGRTNREIAESLYVTIKTVETHLAAVYRKLAVPGRDHLRAQISGGPP
ncbi:ATP-binding protein [Paractinoplanes lichenicola]|uniref:AAA family ATPase n=1 Tax=Paractinoplanes lichenicola TaxID=2802976 RepID=A0ABS1VUK5_9ACTN|nr:LuxR family transcriptional regulator [Actinoplanes lichenicola]MBL7258130.1 AAA family ATPase [Actinoplanes lichenicola]